MSEGLPAVDAMGAVAAHMPRSGANAIIHQAFEDMGGLGALVEWGTANKTDFYTKIWKQTIRREVDVRATRTVEDVLGEIDAEDAIDAEFSEVLDT